MLVCFLGVDGSGKSTIIHAIQKELKDDFSEGIIKEHLRPKAIRSLRELFKRDGKVLSVENPHSNKPSGLLSSFVRWMYYLIDYTLGFYLKVKKFAVNQNTLFIFDRYYYDYFLDQKRMGVSLPFGLIRMGDFFVTKPDIIFCLTAHENIILSRKRELSCDEIKRQNKVLIDLPNRYTQAVVIDTSGELKQVVNEIVELILKKSVILKNQ